MIVDRRVLSASRPADTRLVSMAHDPSGQTLERLLDARRVFTLYRVCKLVSASLDRDATLNAITDAVHELTGAQQTALYLFDDLGNLELQVGRGPLVAPADQDVLGRALREQRIVRVADMQAQPEGARTDLESSFRARSYLAAPLIWRQEILGVVSTACAEPGALTEAEAVLVGELAEQAGAAVAHARDFANEQRLRAESEEILRQYTEQQAQLERVQQQLVQNEKMTAVGQLVQGLAHEMNTPLSVVTSNMSVLERYAGTLSKIARAAELRTSGVVVADDDALSAALAESDLAYVLDDLPALIEESSTATQRVAAIVRSMGSLARHDRGTRARVSIEEAIESALTLASAPLRNRANVVRSFTPVPAVLGHATELIQVFVHVLINAAQALEDKPGTVTVETAYDAPWVVVRVTDTGAGVAPDLRPRVFEPFFTTRAPGQGSGMGLAVCYGIVTRHGGDISLDNAAGIGTTLTVRLPAVTTTGVEPA